VAGQRKYIVDIVGDLPVILMELDSSNNNVKKTYIYANSQIVAQHDGSHSAPRYFYLHDRLGSVRQIIDNQGLVKNTYTYEPFGELYATETTENVSNPFKFTGQYFDSEIDEYYLRARQYDPHIYRFTSRDPAFANFLEPLTLHKYLYCINDPINRIDPAGLWAYYITGGFMGSFGLSAAEQTGIAWDDQGNWGIIGIAQVGGGLPAAASAGINIGITDAPTVLDLQGRGWAVGGSGSLGFFGAGGEVIWGGGEPGYKGIEFSFGAGVSYPLPVEGHIHQTQTYVRPVHSETLTFEDIVGMAAEEAFYQSNTYGEYRMMLDFMVMTGVDLDVLF